MVTLQAIPFQEEDPDLSLLCPVRALHTYQDHTQSFRYSEQLFICFGGQQKGNAVSRQRISHWIVEAILTAYQARGLPCPLGVRAHSTRGMAASAALVKGVSLANIFARFYNLQIEPVSSRVLNIRSLTQLATSASPPRVGMHLFSLA